MGCPKCGIPALGWVAVLPTITTSVMLESNLDGEKVKVIP